MTDPRADAETEPSPGAPPRPEPGIPASRARGRRLVIVPLGLVAVLAALGAIAVTGLHPSPTGSPGAGTVPPAASSAASAIPSAAQPSAAASASAVARGRIAVVDANGNLSTMDDLGGSIVSFVVPGVAFGLPTWSPDGSRIAAVGSTATDASIYVFRVPRGIAAGAGTPVVIYRSRDRPPFYLYWTPDGRKVAFLATETAGISLRIAPADGTAPLDGSGPGAIIRRGTPLYFDWEAADRLLLHVGTGSGGFVGEVGLDGAPVAPAVGGTGDFRAASASRDGRYVAFARRQRRHPARSSWRRGAARASTSCRSTVPPPSSSTRRATRSP